MPENYQNTLFMLILAFAGMFTYRVKVQSQELKGECLNAFRLIAGGATASFLYAAMLCYIGRKTFPIVWFTPLAIGVATTLIGFALWFTCDCAKIKR